MNSLFVKKYSVIKLKPFYRDSLLSCQNYRQDKVELDKSNINDDKLWFRNLLGRCYMAAIGHPIHYQWIKR